MLDLSYCEERFRYDCRHQDLEYGDQFDVYFNQVVKMDVNEVNWNLESDVILLVICELRLLDF